MNTPSQDIKDMLVAEASLGLVFNTNLFVGEEPSEPSNCVTIFDGYGFPTDLTLQGNSGYERPAVYIRVRHKKYIAGIELAQNIKNHLHGKNHETWNGTLYTVIVCSGGPALLDKDENGNSRFIINFNAQRR